MPADWIHDLSHDDMLALADVFTGWSLDPKLDLVRSAKLLGRAESLEDLAVFVGSNWNPEVRERLPLVAFLARKIREGEY